MSISLSQPAEGSVGWSGAVNENFSDIQGAVNALQTGNTDNAVLRADGTGGAASQGSSVTIDDSGNMTVPGLVNTGTVRSDGGVVSFNLGTSPVAGIRSYGLVCRSTSGVGWCTSSTSIVGTVDTALKRAEAKGLQPTDASTGNGWFCLGEVSSAPSGTSNVAKLYAIDNGSGKTQLVVIFGSGAAQVLATEP